MPAKTIRTPARRGLALLLVLLAACTTACAAASPQDVTDGQVATFKRGVQKGCTQRSLERGNDPALSKAYCACMLAVLESALSKEEWQTAAFHDHKDHAKSVAVFLPHMSKVQACRPGAQ